MPENTYTTYEIARFCDVYPSSVIHWINAKKLKAHATPGGHHRVTREDLLAFFKKFGMPIPKEVADSHKKVLVVDDDVDLANALVRAFGRHPDAFKAQACHTGVDALINIGQTHPDLVVLDVVLPKMDGAQVCSILKSKRETRDIRIIGISGKRLSEGNKLDKYELDAFFRKPLDVLDLVDRAAELLGVELAPSR